MRIGIIGNGFVGKATQIFIKNYYRDGADSTSSPTRSEILPRAADTALTDSAFHPFIRHEHFTPIDVYIYDIRPDACVPPGITLEDLDRDCDLLFFCLPTPFTMTGHVIPVFLKIHCPDVKTPSRLSVARFQSGFRPNMGAILCRSS